MKQLKYVVFKHYEKKCYTNNVVNIKKWKIDKRDKEKKESYLCIADMVTGFAYNKTFERWVEGKFTVDSEKYIVRKSNRKGFAWNVTGIGEKTPVFFCEKDFDKNGNLYCTFLAIFKMNKNNLRFIIDYSFYFLDDSKEDATVFIEIGKCSPL